MRKPDFLNLDIFRYNFDDQDFLNEVGRLNVLRAYVVVIVCVVLSIIMFPLDWLRYENGLFSDTHPNTYINRIYFFLHLILSCTIIPGCILYKNNKRIKANNFPALDHVLLSLLVITGCALVPLSIIGMADRGSIIGYAAYLIIVNHFFSINGPRRLLINILCFVTLMTGVVLIVEDNILRYIYFLEGVGIMIPSYLVANIQMNMRYENFFNNRRLEEQNQLIQAHNNDLTIKSLQSQMNPHFIFNTLNSIQHFMLRRDQKTSMNYLSQFSRLIRSIFTYSSQNFITLEDEIDFLRLYLNLETLRFENKIEVDFKVDPALQNKAHEIYLPPLLIQPLIENTFKHGLMHLEENGELNISIFKENSSFYCIIEDNGVGRKAAKKYKDWLHDTTSSIHHDSALNIIEKRLKIFNDMPAPGNEPANFLTIEDLTNEDGLPFGTRVKLTLCLETQENIYKKLQQEKARLQTVNRAEVKA